jgi:hypothetical protein
MLVAFLLVRGKHAMKTHRLVLGSIAIALATAMATTAAAQDPEEAPKRKPAAAAPRKAIPAPAKKAAAPEAGDEQAPDTATPDEAKPADAEGTPDEQAAEPSEQSDAGEAATPDEAPATETQSSESEASSQPSSSTRATTSPEKAKAAVPPMYYGPPELEYVEGGTIPPGYVKDTRIRKGMVIGGAVTWGVGWLLAATAANVLIKERADEPDTLCYDDSSGNYYCNEDHDDDDVPGAAALYVPLLGPFIAMHTMRHQIDGGGNALLFLNGIMQATGFSLLVAGAAAKRTVLVRDPGATVALTVGPGNAMLTGNF